MGPFVNPNRKAGSTSQINLQNSGLGTQSGDPNQAAPAGQTIPASGAGAIFPGKYKHTYSHGNKNDKSDGGKMRGPSSPVKR
jgi:hypothetical protein